MAGHSKWANIKRTKAVKDAQKGQAYAKCSREIIVATKIGGPDPAGNFRLRTAIERAKANGLPNDNIKRAIDKGCGASAGDQMEHVNYEGYGPGGVAVFIETMTDNRNRTAGDIRSYFNKYQGNLGADGCVAWIFKERGLIRIYQDQLREEEVFEKSIEAGAADFEADSEEKVFNIYTEPTELNEICKYLNNEKLPIASAEVTRVPENTITVNDTEQATVLLKLLDAIEAQEDVQAVYANFEMDAALLKTL